MTLVSAGQAPHTVFRCFDTRADAERWALMLQSKGLRPVTLDCEPIGSVSALAGNTSGALVGEGF